MRYTLFDKTKSAARIVSPSRIVSTIDEAGSDGSRCKSEGVVTGQLRRSGGLRRELQARRACPRWRAVRPQRQSCRSRGGGRRRQVPRSAGRGTGEAFAGDGCSRRNAGCSSCRVGAGRLAGDRAHWRLADRRWRGGGRIVARARCRGTIPVPPERGVWLATGHTDMRKGFDELPLMVQETLKRDPHGGHLFVFRGRRGDLIKCLWRDGQGHSEWRRDATYAARQRFARLSAVTVLRTFLCSLSAVPQLAQNAPNVLR
jgi:hypothetical protein